MTPTTTQALIQATLDLLRPWPQYAADLGAIDYLMAHLEALPPLLGGLLAAFSSPDTPALETVRDTLTEDETCTYIIQATRKLVDLMLLIGPNARKGETWAAFEIEREEFDRVASVALAALMMRIMQQVQAARVIDG